MASNDRTSVYFLPAIQSVISFDTVRPSEWSPQLVQRVFILSARVDATYWEDIVERMKGGASSEEVMGIRDFHLANAEWRLTDAKRLLEIASLTAPITGRKEQ